MAQKNDEFKAAIAEILARHPANGKPMTGRAAALKADISTTHVNNMMNGIIPSSDMIRKLADALNEPRCPILDAGRIKPGIEDIEWDRDHYGVLPTSRVTVTGDFMGDMRERGEVVRPRIATEGDAHLRCGELEYQPDDPDIIDVSEKVTGLIVQGNSMLPYFSEGDLVFLRQVKGNVKVGEKYVVRIDNDRTCKTLESIEREDGEDVLTFAPANSIYPRIRIASSRVVFQGVPITKIPKELL